MHFFERAAPKAEGEWCDVPGGTAALAMMRVAATAEASGGEAGGRTRHRESRGRATSLPGVPGFEAASARCAAELLSCSPGWAAGAPPLLKSPDTAAAAVRSGGCGDEGAAPSQCLSRLSSRKPASLAPRASHATVCCCGPRPPLSPASRPSPAALPTTSKQSHATVRFRGMACQPRAGL